MDELFGIEAQARQEGLNQIDRHVLRLDKSKPLLAEIKTSIQVARTGTLPKSALAKACDYTLTLWSRLSCFLEYPELELSNLAENRCARSLLADAIGYTRKQRGRTTSCRHHFDRRNLSPPEPATPRLPQLCAPGTGRFSEQSRR